MNTENNISDKDNKRHIKQTDEYVKKIEQLFNNALTKICQIVFKNKKEIATDKEFHFKDYPKIRKQIEKIAQDLSLSVANVINIGVNKEWKAAINKNETLLKYIAKSVAMTEKELQQYGIKNLEALAQFQQRKIDGMNLSKKVWSYIADSQNLLQAALDIGIAEGESAVSLAKDCKKFLNEPDKLFRRVRDKYGNLQLSKNAKAYHPGQGVYRSSVKNAQRLARSEINIAYRTADYKQYNQWDFVLGIEIHRANRADNYPCDMCETLKGIYPKEFQFVGWHPHCRCYTTTILPSREEFKEYQKQKFQADLQGKPFHYDFKGTVKDLPDNFKQYYSENKDKFAKYKQKPYWLRDNENLIHKQETKDVINNVYSYVKDIQAKNKNVFQSENLATGKMIIKYKDAKSFLQQKHSVSIEQKKMFVEILKHPDKLKVIENSFKELDLTKPKNNLQAKKDRGVRGYRQYEFENYIVLMEDRWGKFEVPYSIYNKKS